MRGAAPGFHSGLMRAKVAAMSGVATLARWRTIRLPAWEGMAARLLAGAEARLLEERGRLPLWLPVALGAGVLLYFALPSEPALAWCWLALPGPALAWWLGRRHPHLGWAAGMLAALALGLALGIWHAARHPPALEPPRTATQLSGQVAMVEALPAGVRVTLVAPRFGEGAPQARHVRVRLKRDDPARPQVGDQVLVRALVRAPAAPAFPGAWDFQRAAWFSGLGGSGFALGLADVAPGEAGPPPLAGLRAAIEARVVAAMPAAAGAVSVALLTGGQSAIPAADLAAMRDSGLAHLLSVSGLHIAIVMGLSFAVARLGLALVPWVALRLPGKLLAGVAALAVGGGYMLLTGSAVPMQRSFGMAALATLALLTGRRAITLRGWALAAAAVMVLQPEAVAGPSFQMSFAAVLALISGWEWLRPRLNAMAPGDGWRRRVVLAVFGLVATSLLAGAATTPFGLYHFGRLQLYGVAANAVAVPLTSALVMPAGMAAVALMPFGLEGLALAPMQWGVEATLWVARCVAAWPGASLVAMPLPGWGLGLVTLGMLWLCLWRGGWRGWGLPLIGLGMLSGSLARPPDLLVSDDARMIAVRTEAGVFLQRQSGGNALVREMWLRAWGAEDAAALPREVAAGGVACTPGGCVLHAVPEVVLLRGDPAREACARAALVVSAEPVRGRCRAQVLDRFSVWREGAHAVWFGATGVTVLSDRAWRGNRPWVPPPPRARGPAEPMAPVE